jgi:tetratricopeptide (TPR) repeat protein
MKSNGRSIMLSCLLVLAAGTLGWAGPPVTGQPAALFVLPDHAGLAHDLAAMKDRPLMILYFFDAGSRPSQEGLLNLDQLAKTYAQTDLAVWAITTSPAQQVADFMAQAKPRFPVLLDKAEVSEQYQARLVLPTVCILGPGLKVLDYFQGGGKTTEVMLVRLAQRELQRKEIQLAKAISSQVVKQNPQNARARAVSGYAALKEGDLAAAQQTFQDLSAGPGEAEVIGKEGLAAVYAKKGDDAKALDLAEEVAAMAPERAYAQVVKGDILYSRGQKEQARQAYEKAVAQKNVDPGQALAHNQLGRLHAAAGDYAAARTLYDQAVDIDPYYVEATSNIGVTYEKEGRWDQALAAFQRAAAMDKNDAFTTILTQKAEQMLALQKDTARSQRMDQLVKDLVQRYEKGEIAPQREDDWTSRPMVLTFIDVEEKGGLPERDGLSGVLVAELGSLLNQSGRVQVVERVVMARLLEELNMGSSQLADPETALKLGRILAAKLIGTGQIIVTAGDPVLNLRLVDTETSALAQVITRPLKQSMLEKELFGLNRDILRTVISKYPLQGYVVAVQDQRILLNLGAAQGVVAGTQFNVIAEQQPVKYKGRMLRSAPKVVAELEVVQVEPDLCYGRIKNALQTLQRDDKVVEKIDAELIAGGQGAI